MSTLFAMAQTVVATSGAQGPSGTQGPAGPGVVSGGLSGNFLVKASNADYDTTWTELNVQADKITSGAFTASVGGVSGNLVEFISGTSKVASISEAGGITVNTGTIQLIPIQRTRSYTWDHGWWSDGGGTWTQVTGAYSCSFNANPIELDWQYVSESFPTSHSDFYVIGARVTTTNNVSGSLSLVVGGTTWFSFNKNLPDFSYIISGDAIDPINGPISFVPDANWAGKIISFFLMKLSSRYLGAISLGLTRNDYYDYLVQQDSFGSDTFNGMYEYFLSNLYEYYATGYYPGNNVSFGARALRSSVMSANNVAIGPDVLSFTRGQYNTAVGNAAMTSNYDGQQNTAVGTFALGNLEFGQYNSAVGSSGLSGLTSGSNNVAVGYNVGWNLSLGSSGSNNTLIGAGSRFANGITNATAIGTGSVVTGSNQIVLGNGLVTDVFTSGAFRALYFQGRTASAVTMRGMQIDGSSAVGAVIDTSASYTTSGAKLLSIRNAGVEKAGVDLSGVGYFQGISFGAGGLLGTPKNTNIAIGSLALANTTGTTAQGRYNVAIGISSSQGTTVGSSNLSIGAFSLQSNSSGSANIALGYSAMRTTQGNPTNNTAIGYQSLSTVSGSYGEDLGVGNVAIGHQTLFDVGSGSYNVAIGYGAGTSRNGYNTITIGNASDAFGDFAINIGSNGTARGAGAISIGASIVEGDNAIGIGGAVSGSNIINIGNGNTQFTLLNGNVITTGSHTTVFSYSDRFSYLVSGSTSYASLLTASLLDSFSTSSIQSAQYRIQAIITDQNPHTSYYVTSFDVLTNKTDVFTTQYATLYTTPSPFLALSADIADGYVRVFGTLLSGTSAFIYKVRTAIAGI